MRLNVFFEPQQHLILQLNTGNDVTHANSLDCSGLICWTRRYETHEGVV